VRRSVLEIAKSKNDLNALANAFKNLYKYDSSLQYGIFGRHASVHGGPPNLVGLSKSPQGSNSGWCAHNQLAFTPWHRIYVTAFEKALGVTLPYLPWSDWKTGAAQWKDLPAPFNTEKLDDGTDNPFYSARTPRSLNNKRRPGNTVRRINGEPGGFDTLRTAIFDSNSWQDFHLIEQPHNNFHGYIGGDMGFPDTAAFDPIFWFHHCEVDRQYESWIQNTGSNMDISDDDRNSPMGDGFPDIPEYKPYLDQIVGDTFDSKKYGYVYDNLVKQDTETVPGPRAAMAAVPFRRALLKTEPVKMSTEVYWMHYFVQPMDSNIEFDEKSKRQGNPNYAGSTYVFGMKMSMAEHDHNNLFVRNMMNNKSPVIINVSNNPIVHKCGSKLKIRAVAERDGKKVTIPDNDKGRERASVHLIHA